MDNRYYYTTNSVESDDSTGTGFVHDKLDGSIILFTTNTRGKIFLKEAVKLMNQDESKRTQSLDY